jgi:hypothetical protein
MLALPGPWNVATAIRLRSPYRRFAMSANSVLSASYSSGLGFGRFSCFCAVFEASSSLTTLSLMASAIDSA